MQNLRYQLTILLLKAVALLPLGVLYVASDVAFLFLYYIMRYRRRRVRKNLENAFPQMTAKELKRTERRYYRHMCDTMVETVKMLHLGDREMQRRVTVTGTHLMEQAAEAGHPVFLFIGHIGNWEWVQEITRCIKAPTVHGELYRPLHSPVMDRAMQTIRNTRYPTLLIPMQQAVRTIIRLRQEHPSFLIGFIADQRPTRHSLHHWTTFMGQDTPYMAGAEEIGRRVDAKFLVLHVTKPRRGHYRMDILDMEPPATPPKKGEYPYVEQYLRVLEANIREQPELYLWSHNRWKYRRIYDGDGTWHAERWEPKADGSLAP